MSLAQVDSSANEGQDEDLQHNSPPHTFDLGKRQNLSILGKDNDDKCDDEKSSRDHEDEERKAAAIGRQGSSSLYEVQEDHDTNRITSDMPSITSETEDNFCEHDEASVHAQERLSAHAIKYNTVIAANRSKYKQSQQQSDSKTHTDNFNVRSARPPAELGDLNNTDRGSRPPEIQGIMDQFAKNVDIRDSRPPNILESDDLQPFLHDGSHANPVQYPPRNSSLDLTRNSTPSRIDAYKFAVNEVPVVVQHHASEGLQATRTENQEAVPLNRDHTGPINENIVTVPPSDGLAMKPPQSSLPPASEPEPHVPFDFHRFLDQLRHRTADPVAKYLRSFLLEFGKKQWMVHEQVKIIRDFLAFIAGKMAHCDVWRGVSDSEFENAKEGMEKLVMNRLYSQTFSPAIPATPTSTKERGKESKRTMESGRRGQHQEDVEHDNVLAQKVRIYKWVRENHLDIAPVGDNGRRFLLLAEQELLKIGSYRAPRDKVICVLNCCKVIFGLLRNSKASDTSADAFMPLLIFVILQAGPENLVSNAQYILRFRNQDKLSGEAGYYVSSLMGAIQFIENLDRTSLTVSDEEFERNVELSVSAIAEREPAGVDNPKQRLQNVDLEKDPLDKNSALVADTTDPHPNVGLQPRSSQHNDSDSPMDDKVAVTSLLRSIQKPLSSIGRMFSEEPASSGFSNLQPSKTGSKPPETPRKLSPAPVKLKDEGSDGEKGAQDIKTPRSARFSAEEAAARQASAEAAEARRLSQVEHQAVVETLASMFPSLDKDIIDDVVRLKEGRIGSAVDALLALNTDR